MSFLYALSGIYNAIRTEFNLRIHIVAANLICIFAYFYGLSNISWAMLIIMAFTVISAELINTAVENAVDTATEELLPTAKLAKDAAAGAVLVMAVASLMVGVCLFGDAKRIAATLGLIFTDLKILIPCLLIGIADMLFLFLFCDKSKPMKGKNTNDR